MKKTLLTSATIALFTMSSAQTVFTKQIIESYGDTTVAFGVTNASEINIGSSGANQTWNFGNIQLSEPEFNVRIPFSTSLPFASEFPQANSASASLNIDAAGNISMDENSFGYSLISDSKYELLGSVGIIYAQGVPVTRIEKYSPAQAVFRLPFSYQDVLNYTINSSTEKSVFTGEDLGTETRTGSGTYTYEGYGKALMPGGTTEENCARFKRSESSTIRQVMSSDFYSMTTEMSTDIEQYDFISDQYATLSKIKMTHYGKTITTFFGEGDTTVIPTTTQEYGLFQKGTGKREIMDIISGINDEKIFAGIEVFPNPTTEQVQLSQQPHVRSVDIIAADGSITPVRDFANSISIDGPKGLYMVRVTLDTGNHKSYKVVKN